MFHNFNLDMAQQMLTSSGQYFFLFLTAWSTRRRSTQTVTKPASSSYKVPVGPAPRLIFEYHVRFQEGPRKKVYVAPWRAVYCPGGNTGATRARDSPVILQSQIWVSFKYEFHKERELMWSESSRRLWNSRVSPKMDQISPECSLTMSPPFSHKLVFLFYILHFYFFNQRTYSLKINPVAGAP